MLYQHNTPALCKCDSKVRYILKASYFGVGGKVYSALCSCVAGLKERVTSAALYNG